MNKFVFFNKDVMTKSFMAIFILWFFSFYSLLFLFVVLFIVISFLFRKKEINLLDKESIETNLVVSPVSGRLVGQQNKNEKIQLLIEVGIFDGYGIYSPNKAEIAKYYRSEQSINLLNFKRVKTQLSLLLKNGSYIKLKFKSSIPANIAFLHARSGDLAVSGSCLGYLPFGGKVVIELPRNSKVLLKDGDKVLSAQTLLASIEE